MSTPYVFSQDVQSEKNYPSFEYNAGEAGAVYHEDREIDGVMYRAANANYNDVHNYWSQSDTLLPSYAVVTSTQSCRRR
jgi:hypothetical protein